MESKTRARRTYTEEYKNGILARLAAGEKIVAVARAEGISPTLFHNWKKKAGEAEQLPATEAATEAGGRYLLLKDVAWYLEKAVRGMQQDIDSKEIKKEKEWHLLLKLALLKLTG